MNLNGINEGGILNAVMVGKEQFMEYKVKHMMDDLFEAMPKEDRIRYLFNKALVDYAKTVKWKDGVMEGSAFFEAMITASYREFIRAAYDTFDGEPPVVFKIAELTLNDSPIPKANLSSIYGMMKPEKGVSK